MRRFLIALVLAGCVSHLEEEVKKSNEQTITDTGTQVVVKDTEAASKGTSQTTKVKQPTVTDTVIEVKTEATAKRPAKTVTVRKHTVTGVETTSAATTSAATQATQETAKATEQKTEATKAEEAVKKEKDSKPSSCALGGVVWYFVIAVGLLGMLYGFLKKKKIL